MVLSASSVSQHASAVEVTTAAKSVLLPCHISFVPDGTSVVWSRRDLDPPTVHKVLESGEDLREQNQNFSRRTSMRSDALKTGDFSLTLRRPRLPDSGTYTCSARMYGAERSLAEERLQVKGQINTGPETEPRPFCQTSYKPYNQKKMEVHQLRV